MDKKILLVDDAAFMRMLIKDALTKNGYTNILEAADGQIACDVYAAEKPDLVIMDITMPNKTGIEALKDIKGMDPMANVLRYGSGGNGCRGYQARRPGLHRKAVQARQDLTDCQEGPRLISADTWQRRLLRVQGGQVTGSRLSPAAMAW